MLRWDYHHPHIMELRYETLFGKEMEVFHHLFLHLGFDRRLIDSGMKYVEKYSFENQKKQGKTGEKQHLSKGISGQWKESFTPGLKGVFKQKYQGLLVKLEYERDENW
jgi:hypothetical protein